MILPRKKERKLTRALDPLPDGRVPVIYIGFFPSPLSSVLCAVYKRPSLGTLKRLKLINVNFVLDVSHAVWWNLSMFRENVILPPSWYKSSLHKHRRGTSFVTLQFISAINVVICSAANNTACTPYIIALRVMYTAPSQLTQGLLSAELYANLILVSRNLPQIKLN